MRAAPYPVQYQDGVRCLYTEGYPSPPNGNPALRWAQVRELGAIRRGEASTDNRLLHAVGVTDTLCVCVLSNGRNIIAHFPLCSSCISCGVLLLSLSHMSQLSFTCTPPLLCTCCVLRSSVVSRFGPRSLSLYLSLSTFMVSLSLASLVQLVPW